MRILRALAAYLTDWKNLLAHTLVGVAILAVAWFLPVKPLYRGIILCAVVGLNILRMRLSEKKHPAESQTRPVPVEAEE